MKRVAVSSNAEAAKRVKGEWNSAAIAGDMAAGLYGLTRLAEKIEDRPDNSTRFLMIGSQEVPPTGDDKTSIIVSMSNKPGALHELLVPFHDNGIDLTRAVLVALLLPHVFAFGFSEGVSLAYAASLAA